jgi:hypothetical protein
MPTFERLALFASDWRSLTPQQQRAFLKAIKHFVADLRSQRFRPGLRVKGVQGAEGIFEMSWAPDGRATFSYGEEQRPGEPHIIWRRVGTHSILKNP